MHFNLQTFSHTALKVKLLLIQQTGMQITSQDRLEVLFGRTPYVETFRYIQNLKPKQIGFQDVFYNLYHTLYSHICCERLFYIRAFNKEKIALFYLPTFPPQAIPKISDLLYADIVYTIHIDASPASNDIKNILKN